MSDSTWLLLQLVVAGCTGLLMLVLVRAATSLWNRVAEGRRVRLDRKSGPRIGATDRR